MKSRITYFLNSYFLLSLIGSVFLFESCIGKDDLCEVTESTQDPTEEQVLRFGYLRGNSDSFQIVEYGETDTVFTYFEFPRKGDIAYFRCLEQPKGCICTKTLYYYKVIISCRAFGPNQFEYFINYDYVNDTVEFYMPVSGVAKIAGKDLRNGNAKSYVGNYIHKNKLYTHVHKFEANIPDRFEAYVNDSVGLIYYKFRDDVYVAERF